MGLHDRLKSTNGNGSFATLELSGQPSGEVAQDSGAHDPYSELKTRIHHACIQTRGAELFKREATGDLTERVTRAVTEQLVLDRTPLTRDERRQIIREITDDILGYGPLEPFLRDDSVTEVMCNSFDRIYVERNGKIERTQAAFADNSHLLRIIDKIVSQVGRRVDEASPMVDARLPDGSRVNAIIPPLALKGPTLTIRKFSRDPYTMNDLISFGTISPRAAQFLAACVKGKLNILVSGGTGTGKTTTLNAMSAFIPGDERIVTIEDAAELQLQQEHVITLESRPPNIEGQGEVRIRELVRNALRMRPDRIIVGEVRGAAIREQISSAFDLLVQITRLVDGSRRITNVTEVLRMESDTVTLQDLFVAKPPDEEQAAESGAIRFLTPLKCTGLKPHFLEKMAANGVVLQPAFFSTDDEAPAVGVGYKASKFHGGFS